MPEFVNEQGRRLTADPESILEETLTLKPGWRRTDAPPVDAGPAEPVEAEPEDLVAFKRDELDLIALDLGIEDPEDLPNKGAVIDAINAARAATTED